MAEQWRLTKTFTFEASHKLPNHQGKCRRLHGHSWKLDVTVTGSELAYDGTSSGMITDYGDIKEWVAPLIDDYLDHWHLNETLALENPTSEEVARFVWQWLKSRSYHLRPSVRLEEVVVYETCTSKCAYKAY